MATTLRPSSRPFGETEPLLNPPEACSHGNCSCDEDILSPREKRTNLYLQIGAAMYSFFVLGLFASTLGVLLPRIEEYYHLTDRQVSLIFIAGPTGYVLAAQLSESLHRKAGQRGIAMAGPVFALASATTGAMHPPFPLLLLGMALGGFGCGLLDGSWCAWAGAMDRSNAVSGFLHGSFSLGAAVGPVLAGTIVSVAHKPWFEWYYVLTLSSAIKAVVLAYAFRFETADRYLQARTESVADTHHLKETLRRRVVWVAAIYFLAYVGTETSISGWIVVYMTRVRHATPHVASICSSGFWMGMAIGRVMLGFVTDKTSAGLATGIYIVCAMGFELAFASVDTVKVSAVLVSLLGFFMGPLFPSGVVQLTRRLPPGLHVSAVSFVASLGQVGAGLLPYCLGTLIDSFDIRIYQTMICMQLAFTLVAWLAFLWCRS